MLCAVPPIPIAMIVGIIVAVILIIVIVIIVIIVVLRRRRSPEKPPVTLHDPDKPFPAHSTKPVPFAKFGDHVDSLAKNSNLEYANEFEVSVLSLRNDVFLYSVISFGPETNPQRPQTLFLLLLLLWLLLSDFQCTKTFSLCNRL